MDQKFSEQLDAAMNEAGISNEQLAATLDMSGQAIRNWRKGTTKPKPFKADAILNGIRAAQKHFGKGRAA